VLNYSADACKYSQFFNCQGMPNPDVKAFVNAEIDKRKAIENRTVSERTFYVASGGLAISFLSLVVSGVGMARGRSGKKK